MSRDIHHAPTAPGSQKHRLVEKTGGCCRHTFNFASIRFDRRARIAGTPAVRVRYPLRPQRIQEGRCAATRCLPDTSLPSTRCRRCSTRRLVIRQMPLQHIHPRVDGLDQTRHASPRCRPPPSPASACPSHSACYSPTTSAPTFPMPLSKPTLDSPLAIPHVLARIIVHPKCLLFRQDSANSFSH